jgi:hypothetical protein
MIRRDDALYSRWERELREISLKGMEDLMPPVAEWPSFLVRSGAEASDDSFEALGLSARQSLAAALESTPPEAAEAGSAEAGSAPAAAQVPDPLRAEIEDFLNKDKPAGASEEELAAFLKSGIDPNMDPEE